MYSRLWRPHRIPNYRLLLLLLAIGSAPAAWAYHEGECHPNQQGCTPDGELYIPYQKPAATIQWKLKERGYRWVDAWRPHQNESKWWPKETYNPQYVYPDKFDGQFFDQCQNKTDWDYFVNSDTTLASQAGRYRWSVNGVVQVSSGDCFLQELVLPGEGIHDVKLEVFAPGAATPYLTRTEDVRVRDYLIVLFGDSAASGEGAPDLQRASFQEWGTWTDRRCHRSKWAAVPRAVEELESDPHSTVTFLNFACSGATLKRWEAGSGVGILDRYAGIEPTEEALFWGDKDPFFYLPSQVDQLWWALNRDQNSQQVANPREVDMLIMTGGINDVRFSKLALTCVLLDNCHNQYTALFDATANAVKSVFQDLASLIPGAYVDLRDALLEEGIDVKETYVMQYPGAFEFDDGSRCTSMLEDVLPPASVWNLVLNPAIAPVISLAPLLGPFLEAELGVNSNAILLNALSGDLQWSADEIDWFVDSAMLTLDNALRDGAAAAGFTFVEGALAKFDKHGYCANDNWMVRADESSFIQGPWNTVSRPLNVPPFLDPTELPGLDIHAMTKGVMHPGIKGHAAWAQVLKPTMDTLRNRAPIAKADNYKINTATEVELDTGFGAGVLLNDYDPDDDPIRSILVSGPSKGTATLSQDGRLRYKPNSIASPYTDTLYYQVSDGGLTSPKVKVTIAVGNSRYQPPSWNWTLPGAEERPVVEIGGMAEFPVCNKCGDLVVRLDPARLPPDFGRITFERAKDRWYVRYLQNGTTPRELPYLDIVALEIGRVVLGVFQREGRAEIPVQIEGTAPPPAWSWIFQTPESVLLGRDTRFDLCDNCGDLEVRVTVLPQAGRVVVERDAARNRWVATYWHNGTLEPTGDGFGVEIGSRNGDVFTPLDSTRLSLTIVRAGG